MKSSKKHRHNQKKNPSVIVWILFLTLLVAGTALILKNNNNTVGVIPTSSDIPLTNDLRKQLTSKCKAYMDASTHRDNWWLQEPLSSNGELVSRLEFALTKVQDAVTTSSAASPLAKQVSMTFPTFFVSQYKQGTAMVVKAGKIDRDELANSFEICFIPESEYRTGPFGTFLYYDLNWNAVMIGAISWPDVFFKGVLMHEIGHAYWMKTRGQPANFTPEWFEDEVTMHELESSVLDHNLDGRYSKRLIEICKQHPLAKTTSEIVTSVSVEDLLELDQIVGVRDCGPDIRGAACSQHIVALGFADIKLKKGTMEDKINHYRWIIGK